MNLLNKLTIANLKLNKKRTTVTIIGIILATALITAVAGVVSSFRQTMITASREEDGDYHYEYKNVPANELKYIKENRNVESYYITQDLGYVKLQNSQNEYKPYLYLMAYNGRALEKSSIKLTEGRMPKNDSEIVISEYIQKNGKVEYNIGDKVELDISDRLVDGEKEEQSIQYSKGIEKLEKKFTKTYEIVGKIERPNWNIEPYSAPGYTIITYLDSNNIEGNANIYARFTKEGLKNKYQVNDDILGLPRGLSEKLSKSDVTEEEIQQAEKARYQILENTGVLMYEALDVSESNLSMIYILSIIVIGIIIVTSVFCIRNSFAISITEKMKQYGMLASIGATPKQIRKNVFYEALILSVIGIPLGLLCGILAVFIILKVVGILLKDSLNGIEFVFSMPCVIILIAILLSAITVFLSAKKSAKRAAKVSPIEAIRSNEDIKIKSKKIKSPKLIKKIFGVGGDIAYKNLKRNKKKYRTTVISIVVSVAIFISMSSFMTYVFKVSSIYYNQRNYNIEITTSSLKDIEKLKEIANLDGINRYAIHRTTNLKMNTSELKYSEKGKEYVYDSSSTEEEITIIALGENEYKRYIKELGLTYEEAKDKVILVDDIKIYDTEGKKYQQFNIYNYKTGEKMNGTNGENNKKMQLEIIKKTDKRPIGVENLYADSGVLIVSDEWIDKNAKDTMNRGISMYIDAQDPDKLEEDVKALYKDLSITNYNATARQEKAIWTVIAIFLYGFITVISLIGITNIFNTITTNMNLRSKEFANLKSIGMTKKEFNKMIRLESIFYGTKALLIGLPIGVGLSYAIYKAFCEGAETGFLFPTNGVIISVVAVFVLISSIMHYSLSKINKQNIIETIRKDNI